MSAYKKIELPNGTRVILVPHKDVSSVTVLTLYEVGSRYETEALSGASHYIEHMMFKGTERRPNTMSISRDLDAVGAEYNAFTSKDYTGYYIKLQADKLELAADMLEDMVYHSLYRPQDLDSERKVIIEEIRMYEDNPLMLVEELMEQEVFCGTPLGRRITGTVETMMGIGREELVKYRDAYYAPERTVVAIAGKFDEEEALALIRQKWGSRKPGKAAKPYLPFAAGRTCYNKPRVRLLTKETEQVQLALGFPAYPYGHPRLAALNVMSNILGGTMSSRLFLTVREKEGLAYFIRSASNPYQDVGTLAIQAGLAKDRLEQALNIIVKELHKIASSDVTAEELSRAKENIKGRTVLGLEDSSQLADWYAKQELLVRRTDTPEDKLKKIAAVTKDEVRRVAADIFRAKRMTTAIIGPYEDGTAFTKHAELL
ncbi:MAG: pitrilysin family protein [Patescibacteria group bacterium]|jgi:predicted Zn-dependent peptidase